ncbi:FIST signal transduction protein [cf. Phormidesmis sp. LEGE 11477]|uniref:FIST signal transduction protein n=1 Tax=cf. Phormidesmis sp. LEGE 11477 TaxID=1828680 RepID=UPI00187E34EB|nr:FIST N-terminal domain-containing protein [cf. Phormidesmis sp. LEGE 11477]MBE9063354.1 FIST C-terminal domain-containing protein [cf. Phormidesmis sp. LEGE 11477]
MLKVVVGHSVDIDSENAVSEVLNQCAAQLEGQQPQAGILLSAIDFDHTLILSRIQDIFPGMSVIGGTTYGEISSVLGFQEESLALMMFCSDTVEIRAGLGRGLSKDADAAAKEAIASLGFGEDIGSARLCITIPDGLANGTEPALRQLQSLLPAGVPIVGGRSGDQFQFEQTYQFFGGEVVQNGLPILVFCGDIRVSHGVASGWQPLSRKAVITKCNSPVVHEIDHQPATKFYQDYLGDFPISGEYPLAIFEGESDRFYLRASNHWNLETGEILFTDEIPEQAQVQITYATCDNIVAATQDSIKQALAHYSGERPAAVLLFSCAARRWLLGHRTKEEYELGQQLIENAVPVSGFYTYGEIGPLEIGGQVRYHQETLVTVVIGTE